MAPKENAKLLAETNTKLRLAGLAGSSLKCELFVLRIQVSYKT